MYVVFTALTVLLATVIAHCSTTSINTSTTTTSTSPASALGYSYNEKTRHWYKRHEGRVTWDEASVTCEGEGGYLVILNDEGEARVVQDMMIRSSTYYATWIGLRDRRRPYGARDWRSVHGEPLDQLYHEWDISRSNDEYHPCAVLYNMRLYDYNCQSETFRFICERDS